MVALSVPGVNVLDVVQDHRRQALEAMQTLTRLKASGDDAAMVLVVDSLLFRHEATIRWLDTCEARVTSGQLAPVVIAEPDTATARHEDQVRS